MAARARRGKLRARGGAALLALAVAVGLTGRPAAAQDVPPNDDWRQIETARFRVTYPGRLEPIARRAAARGERAWDELASLLPRDPGGRVEIVLTDHTDISNGFATVAPRKRILIYARPPVDAFDLAYFDDWMELVVTHELTHIFHLDYTSRFGRVLRAVFGRPPTTWPFFPEQDVPSWVVEGTAVYYETALTTAGRGEGTYHDMVRRTAALEGRFDPIDRASGDSPDWPGGERVYVYGSGFFEYLLKRHGQDKMGAFIRAVGGQWIPYRVNAAAKKAFGVSFSTEWNAWTGEEIARADALRSELAKSAPITITEHLTRDARYVVDPKLSPDGRVLAFARSDGLTDAQLRVAAPDGSSSRELARLNDAGEFTWLADGTLVTAEYELADPYRMWSDLYRISASGERTRITRNARLEHPAAMPDGQSVVGIQNRDGRTDLVRVDLKTGTVRSLASQPDVDWAFPAPSPDGKWIAASRHTENAGFDLVLLRVDERGGAQVVRQVTSDRAIELSPTWSPDGRWLLWSSDRSGISNLYAAPFEASGRLGPIHQVTNLLTGIAYPSVDPAQRWIYGAVYHAKGWEVERFPFDPAKWFEPQPLAAVYAPVTPEALPPPAVGPALAYDALKTIGPKFWEPLVWAGEDVFVRTSGTVHVLRPFVGLGTWGDDVIGRHAWSLSVGVSPTDAKLIGALSYQYAGLGNPLLSLDATQTWDAYGPVTGKETSGRIDTMVVRRVTRTAEAGGTALLRRFRVAGSLGLSAAFVTQTDALLDRDLEPSTIFHLGSPTAHFGDVRATATLSSARGAALSISPEQGAALSLQGRVRSQLGLADSLRDVVGRDGSYSEAVARLRVFAPLRGLGLSRHVIALRGSAGVSAGPGADAFHFDVGGANGAAESISGLDLFGGSSYTFPVRGYANGVRSGSRAWSATAEYRFPIVRVNRGVGLVPIHLDQVSGSLFGDAGDAWGPEALPIGGRTTLWSGGAELSADLLTFFSIPLPLRVGVAVPGVAAAGRGTSPVGYIRVGASF